MKNKTVELRKEAKILWKESDRVYKTNRTESDKLWKKGEELWAKTK